MRATGYSQLESGHVESFRAQVAVISGAAQTVGSGTGNMAVYKEEYIALLQQFLEDEGDRALCARLSVGRTLCTRSGESWPNPF